MSSLSLDGGSRYIGTEFIKLEITGSSNLAKEAYVGEQIVLGAIGDTYTQAQIDGFLTNKADTTYVVGNFYTQSQVDTSLGLKANQSTTYTKTEVDNSLALKANQATTYTKTENDTALALKADQATTYTKTEVDNTVSGKVDLTNANQTINGKVNIGANPIPWALIDTTDGHRMRFTHGKHIDVFTEPETTALTPLYLNYFNQGNVRVGDTVGSLSINNDNPNSKTFSCNGDAEILSTLHSNTFNSNGANDITFQRNSVEYCKLREDGPIRLLEFPTDGGVSANRLYGNYFMNRSYLFDAIFEGSNVAGDGREEYMRYNYATGILSIAKPLSLSSALKQDVIDTTSDVDLTVKRNNVDYFTLQVDGSNKLMNFASNGAVSANKLFGNYFSNRGYSTDTIFEGSNTAGNDRVEYMRYDFTNEVIQLPKKLLVNGGDGKTEIYENVETTNNVFRIWNKETTNTPVIHIGAGATSNDMVLTSSGFTFNKAVACSAGLSVGENLTLTYNKKIVWDVNSIVETSSPTVPITRFDAPNTGSAYWFFVGPAVNDAYRIFTISNTEVLSKRVFKCNNIDTENNTDLVFKRNTVEFMRFNVVDSLSRVDIPVRLALSGGLNQSIIYEADEVTQNSLRIWNKDTTHANSNVAIGVGAEPNVMFFKSGFAQCKDEFRVNKINTTGNVNFYLQQNGTNMLTYDKDDGSYPNGLFKFDTDVSVRTDKFIQCQTLRAHIFDTHPTLQSGDNDISFRYAGVTYMFYDKSLSNLQMRTDINSTNDITCVALTQTSDKRLKTDIQSITTNCSNIIKKVEVRKYKFINDKEEKTILGFIADEVEDTIPKEFTNIVNTKNEYKSLNYSNMNCILWKALQEVLTRLETVEEELKELKKPKTRTKATKV